MSARAHRRTRAAQDSKIRAGAPNRSPKITTILPTYQRPETLARAIRSVTGQSFQDWTLLVLDDASQDRTADMVYEVARGDARITFLSHPTNIGAMANFQYGMERVSTPYFSFLSDDDFLAEDFYASALRELESHADARFAATRVVTADASGFVLRTTASDWQAGYYPAPKGLLQLAERGHFQWAGLLFRAQAINEIGTLDPSAGLAADVAYQIKLAARFPFVVSASIGAFFSVGDETLSGRASPIDTLDQWLYLARELRADRDIPAEIRLRAADAIARRAPRETFYSGVIAVRAGRVEPAAEAARRLSSMHDGGRGRALKLVALLGHVGAFRGLLRLSSRLRSPYERKRRSLRRVTLNDFG